MHTAIENIVAVARIAAQVNEPGTYAVHLSGEAYDEAMALARGSYQEDIVRGREAISGATLTGKAREWAGKYASSRAALMARLEDAELGREVRGPHGRRVLIIGRDLWAL